MNYQWWTHLDYIHTDVISVHVMSLVFSKDRVDGLQSALKNELLKTGKNAIQTLCKELRKDDTKAYNMVRNRLTVVNRSSEEKALLADEYAKVRESLGQGTFAKTLVEELESLAGL